MKLLIIDRDTFTIIDDAKEKVQYLLKNPDLIEKIAKNGHLKAKEMFSYERQMREILKIV